MRSVAMQRRRISPREHQGGGGHNDEKKSITGRGGGEGKEKNSQFHVMGVPALTHRIPNESDIVQQTLPTRGHGRRSSYRMTRRRRCRRRQLHSCSSSPLFVFVAFVVRTLVVVVIIIPRRRHSHRVDVPRMLDPLSIDPRSQRPVRLGDVRVTVRLAIR